MLTYRQAYLDVFSIIGIYHRYDCGDKILHHYEHIINQNYLGDELWVQVHLVLLLQSMKFDVKLK
jgi:hypothetical protein